MPRYIDAKLAEKAMKKLELEDIAEYGDDCESVFDSTAAIYALRDVPTADVAPVVPARWDSVGFDRFWNKFIFGCTRCQRRVKVSKREDLKDFPYCHCGAKMDEKDYQFDVVDEEVKEDGTL